MRAPFTALLALLAATTCAAADLTIVRIWPGYRTDESFARISEYFGKEEDVAGQHILRTQLDARTGYYFLLRVKNSGAPITDTKIEIQLITPFAPEPQTYTFTTALPKGSHAFNLGLTGTDWPGTPKDQVVAWQLRILSASGAELAREQSFLWSLPEKK